MTVTKKPAKASAHRAVDSPAKLFKNKRDWAAWLDRNHAESTGLWLQIAKKGSKRQTVTYGQSLEVALFGKKLVVEDQPEQSASANRKWRNESRRLHCNRAGKASRTMGDGIRFAACRGGPERSSDRFGRQAEG
jgi:hypothetical protein